jgi:ankyrin repeat protein
MSNQSQQQAETLGFAAADGDLAKVERLLNEGIDPNQFDEIGLTPLHYAARAEHFAVVALLVARGADVNAHDPATIGNTPLCEIAARCSLPMAKLLINAGANPNHTRLDATKRTRPVKKAKAR